MNVSIHGIEEEDVESAPRFPELANTVRSRLEDKIVASHMPFDRVAITRVCEKYELPILECRWLDTARVCRRAWKQFSRKGYGLKDVATWCGISFHHHDALEDARTAGLILLRAITDSEMTLEDWVTRSTQPLDPEGSRPTRTGDPNGPLAGENVVFTGALSMPRREAADLAASVGCNVSANIGMRTTILVLGEQDIRKLGGHKKSSKHRKAEDFLARGQEIRIIGEADFLAMTTID